MPSSREISATELILRGRIADHPLTFIGTLESGKLTELSGCVTLNTPLSSLLPDLGAEYREAAGVLNQLLGEKGAAIVLEKVAAGYRNGEPGFAQVGLLVGASGSRCQLALLKAIGHDGFAVGLELSSDQAPFKGNDLSGLIGEISIGKLGVYFASEALARVAFFGSDDFRDAASPPRRAGAAGRRDFPKGLTVSAQIRIGGVDLLDMLERRQDAPAAGSGPRMGGARAASPGTTPAEQANKAQDEAKTSLEKGLTYWLETNKSIGPLTVRRVGLSYDAPRIAIRLDAGLQLSVLTLSLEGLGLSYPIDQFTTDPKRIWEHLRFHLDGASVAFARGPLTISGGLIKVSDAPLQLDGSLLIQTSVFTFSALGSYADLNGTPSLFVFAALHKELGGPACFFVTGLAAGFGINRALKLPAINDVHNFPLVKAATDPDYLGRDLDLRKVSQKIGEYIFPMPGNFWIAAGVKFTSFGQIDSFALLSVSFGTQFEIALLGMSRIRVPKQLPGTPEVPAIAFAELAFKVALVPASGVLSLEARLTEASFVLRKDFRLRGGFAFYAWFAGTHEGDFVVSIGGYHPKFKPPAHYPRPDPVEFAARLDAIAIRGFCYFALCPSAIMAGGGLSVVYEQGGLRAWFIAQADFLVQWKPVYYDIAIGVSIGVSLRFEIGAIQASLSVELAAALALHGPPLGGTARVSLFVVTVEIEFGEAKRVPPPLLWESGDPEKSFAKAFLPNPRVTTIAIADGLLEESRVGETTVSRVSPQKLAFDVRTLVPATAVRLNGAPLNGVPQPRVNGRSAALGVRPMGQAALHSRLDVVLAPDGDESPEARRYLDQYIAVALVTRSVPLALWGQPVADKDGNKPPAAGEQLIDDALVGLEIRTKPGPCPWETPVYDLAVLAYDRETKDVDWQMPKAREALPAFGDKTISNTLTALGVGMARSAILAALAESGRGIMKASDVRLDRLAQDADSIFQDGPAMARAGQYPPRGYLET